jgi:hypothetical protein
LICSWVKAIFVIKLFERFFRVAQNIVAARMVESIRGRDKNCRCG